MTFEELGLKPEILNAISRMGFETPTPVQAKVIPRLLENKGDMVALAQTGTGKTAAFGLPILNMLDHESRSPQALIMCPTRELCVQIARDLTVQRASSETDTESEGHECENDIWEQRASEYQRSASVRGSSATRTIGPA